MKKEHLEEMTTEAKGLYMYSTLRTCLDPSSEVWDHPTMQMKVEIFKKFLTQGTTLQDIVSGV